MENAKKLYMYNKNYYYKNPTIDLKTRLLEQSYYISSKNNNNLNFHNPYLASSFYKDYDVDYKNSLSNQNKIRSVQRAFNELEKSGFLMRFFPNSTNNTEREIKLNIDLVEQLYCFTSYADFENKKDKLKALALTFIEKSNRNNFNNVLTTDQIKEAFDEESFFKFIKRFIRNKLISFIDYVNVKKKEIKEKYKKYCLSKYRKKTSSNKRKLDENYRLSKLDRIKLFKLNIVLFDSRDYLSRISNYKNVSFDTLIMQKELTQQEKDTIQELFSKVQ